MQDPLKPIQVDLIWLTDADDAPSWSDGDVHVARPEVQSIRDTVERALHASTSEACLFWDRSLPLPSAAQIQALLRQPYDLWHAGLTLGVGTAPEMLDFVQPLWMHNKNPDREVEATSWRLSLHACLVRTNVLRQLGHLSDGFSSLEGAALEMGHRYIRHGAIMRHIPALVDKSFHVEVSIPLADELRFVYYRFGYSWALWALARALLSGFASAAELINAARQVLNSPQPAGPSALHPLEKEELATDHARVTVLIPTLDRYAYLHTLLDQLRTQTIRPFEIIIVDQSPTASRDRTLAMRYSDLPLRIFYQDEPGQCSSRNTGLAAAEGDYVLLIDDDDEVPPDLIENHLKNIRRWQADVSSGVADEIGAGPLPDAFTIQRISDVFPANNSLVRMETLRHSGLFDLAYERGKRADADLGMRLYLNGALKVLNPGVKVLHHHAPHGGLRKHNARRVTYASSRSRISHLHVPSVSEIYYAKRYFTDRQLREMLWLRVFGTLRLKGNVMQRIAKLIVGIGLLPNTIRTIKNRREQAEALLDTFPQIPDLDDTACEDELQRDVAR